MARRIALDVAEDEHGRRGLFEADLIERADLKIGVGAIDVFEIADLLGEFQALAEIAQGLDHHGLAIAHRLVHAFSPLAPPTYLLLVSRIPSASLRAFGATQ